MLKSIFCLWILALITVNAAQFEINDNIRNFLARVKISDLPPSVQLSLIANQGRNDNGVSHWCCINEQPMTTITQTKIEYATHTVATKTKVGYTDCGFLGLWKCSHHVTTTRVELYSFIQTFQVPSMAACNSHEMKCCAGYLLVADNCHAITDLAGNQELLQFLNGIGLLGTVGK